ncbi:MAG: HlyD family type I secretion periplasmic adaptor subunit [Candidatus Thiothrix sulfatifontis]|nr:MAG: HlyD family type I secretion periplasmic adaptor subunit [Candidatus Thiothrix sulfatifontis]
MSSSVALGNVIQEGTLIAAEGSSSSITLKKDDGPYRIFGITVLVLMFGAFFLWSTFAPLDQAVVSMGRTVVASQNKVVQHMDGGIVNKIHVRDGDIVTAGTVLLELDDVQLKAQLDSTEGQLWEVEASLERLRAERDGVPLQWTTAHLKTIPTDIIKTQEKLFEARQQAQVSGQNALKQRQPQAQEQIIGLQQQITGLEARFDTLVKRRNSLDQDIGRLQGLFNQRLISDIELREKERESTQLEGDMASTKAEVARSKAEIARIREGMTETGHQVVLNREEYLKEVSTQLSELQARRTQLHSQQVAVLDKLARIVIKAPVDGKVKGFEVVTVGAVLQAGAPIMEIVPNGQAFKIIAEVEPAHIDVISPGLDAEIRLSVFDNARYFPVIYAKVDDVSADTLTDPSTKMSYYKTSLSLKPESLSLLDKEQLELVSGMPVEVMILTGERTLLDYLLKPFTDMLARAFNEA